MSNPKKLHLEQLEEACRDLSISSPAREKLKDLMEAMKRDDATYILSLFQEHFRTEAADGSAFMDRAAIKRRVLLKAAENIEGVYQRIAREYTTT